jgi:prepilin-type processing-associated H-X9-DG protein
MLQEFTDGTSHTIMVVEADPDRAVVWTKPDDWEYDATQPLAGLGHAHPGGFNVLFADGSVRFIPKTIDPQGFHALLTIDAGDVPPDLDNRP